MGSPPRDDRPRELALVPPSSARRPAVTVAVLGKRVGAQLLEHETAPAGLDIRTVRACVSDFERDLVLAPSDVLVLELTQLGDSPEATVRRLVAVARARLCLVLYDYAARDRLGALEQRAACRLLHHPPSVDELRQAILDGLALADHGAGDEPSALPRSRRIPGAPARRFDDAELGRLAEIPSTIECECPNHLARLVASLAAFERYAATCAIESSADEEMHGALQLQVGRARELVEQGLVRLLEHEGIEL